MAKNVKSVCDVVIANVKTVCDVTNANVKMLVGVDNTSGGGGAVAFVGITSGVEENDGTQVITRPTITAGNLVVVTMKWEDAVVTPTVSDPSGAYTAIQQTNISANAYCAIYYKQNHPGGTNVAVTVGFGAGTFHNVSVLEFSGASTTAALDDSEVGSGTGTAVATANLTTTTSNCGLVCVVARYNAGTMTPGSGYSEEYDGDPAYFVEQKISGASGSYAADATINSSQIWAAVSAAFKP